MKKIFSITTLSLAVALFGAGPAWSQVAGVLST